MGHASVRLRNSRVRLGRRGPAAPGVHPAAGIVGCGGRACIAAGVRLRGAHPRPPRLANFVGFPMAGGSCALERAAVDWRPIRSRAGSEVSVIEAVMLWNEPNNASHWDFVDVDPEWRIFSDMAILA